ncbi:hypothetical protein ABID92_000026 [Frigoribacterium sp. PvP120]|uniref:DEAD/DEAH box helicase n=1 Tax=unclassified Frigoribacterium TaxID=2627005 RepID=UPI001AE5BED6|nr:DEAD/DEAH box helicase [Frigoribacterium sp. PvP121]MBP1242147.1 hypothetical protein [Frigoribacterium sp. PvP121]
MFLAELVRVREVRGLYGAELQLGTRLKSQLQVVGEDRRRREAALSERASTDLSYLTEELIEAGFLRPLKSFQLVNLARLLALPHGADFSVPGAGKTTVALANFALQRHRGIVDKLLVIGPIAAFEAWRVDSADSFEMAPRINVHTGPGASDFTPRGILLTNYNRVAGDYERIRNYVAGSPTQVVLDEAHRIKRGVAGVHGRAVLDLAYVARRRDVLTGTPTPQGASDAVAIIQFLYPGQDRMILPANTYDESSTRDPDVVERTGEAIRPYFVRTRKSELDIPKPVWSVVKRPMRPVQQAIYNALLGRYRGELSLPADSRREFDRLGRIVMYLLEAASNPALLVSGSDASDQHGFLHPPLDIRPGEALATLLGKYQKYERPWKYDFVVDEVTKAKRDNNKVLVWTTFVKNIRVLERELAAFNPAVIHGGVPSETSALPGRVTREMELDRFRNDDACSVLIANPAAAGEGISLHHWCHHAIYLDRTFSAGNFLQSQDRIHRLGLDKKVETRFTLLLSEGTIDDVVDARLEDKVRALGELMDDPGLVQIALPSEDEDVVVLPAEVSDASQVYRHVSGR